MADALVKYVTIHNFSFHYNYTPNPIGDNRHGVGCCGFVSVRTYPPRCTLHLQQLPQPPNQIVSFSWAMRLKTLQ